MKDLNQNEILEINGGSFAMDVGWFIGHFISGDFGKLGGWWEAYIDYQILYAK